MVLEDCGVGRGRCCGMERDEGARASGEEIEALGRFEMAMVGKAVFCL